MCEKERYQFITSQIDKHADRIYHAFALFVKLAVSIVGGFVWIITREMNPSLRQRLAHLCPHAFLLVAVAVSLLIIVNIRGKWIFRNLEADFLNKNINRPKFPGSCLGEIIMISVMAGSTLLFYIISHSRCFR